MAKLLRSEALLLNTLRPIHSAADSACPVSEINTEVCTSKDGLRNTCLYTVLSRHLHQSI
ncbi:hypothetical protein MKW92_021494 [Papaver armeniacum]|nr:hypothetical protein MKW92_021494 [Papaver armeniacum]